MFRLGLRELISCLLIATGAPIRVEKVLFWSTELFSVKIGVRAPTYLAHIVTTRIVLLPRQLTFQMPHSTDDEVLDLDKFSLLSQSVSISIQLG